MFVELEVGLARGLGGGTDEGEELRHGVVRLDGVADHVELRDGAGSLPSVSWLE